MSFGSMSPPQGVTTMADDLDRLRQRIETMGAAAAYLANAGYELGKGIDELNKLTKGHNAQVAKIREEIHDLWEHVTAAGGGG